MRGVAVTLGLLLVLALATTGCGGAASTSEAQSTALANPMVEKASIQEAADTAGFASCTPGWMPDGYTQSGVWLVGGAIAQADYTNPAGDTITFRTAKAGHDITGDYTIHSHAGLLTVNGIEVGVVGSAADVLHTATLAIDDVHYAFMSTKGLTENEMVSLVGGLS